LRQTDDLSTTFLSVVTLSY